MAGQHPGQCDSLAGPGPCRTAGGQGPGGREHVHLPMRGSDPGTAMWPRRLRCLLNASRALLCATRCPCLGWNPNGRKSCPCLAPDCQVSAGRGAHAQGLQRQGVEGTAPGSGARPACPSGKRITRRFLLQVCGSPREVPLKAWCPRTVLRGQPRATGGPSILSPTGLPPGAQAAPDAQTCVASWGPESQRGKDVGQSQLHLTPLPGGAGAGGACARKA